MFLPAPVCFLCSKLYELRETIAKLHPGCWTWTREARSGGQFGFPTHRMFFQPRHGTVILFRSAWVQHCTMPIQDRRRQLGCALYLRKETLAHYLARQTNLSRINEALNESMRTKNCTRRRGKRKIGPLEGALRLTYCGSALRICDETSIP
jgi:hypothetical protein